MNAIRGPRAGGGIRETTPVLPRGSWALRSRMVRSPGPGEGPPLSYLNSPLPVPPGDLVRPAVGTGDVILPVRALGRLLGGLGELEKMKCSRQLL